MKENEHSKLIGDETIIFNIVGLNKKRNNKIVKTSSTAHPNEVKQIQIVGNSDNTDISSIATLLSLNQSSIKNKSVENAKNKTKKQAAVELPIGIYFRVLIFDASNNNFIDKIDGISSNNTILTWDKAERNKTYKWIAYTLDSFSSLPSFPANPQSSDFIINLSTLRGTQPNNLYWDEGTITTSNQPYYENKSNILFKPKQSSLTIVISTRAMFDVIESLDATVTGFSVKGGHFNLKSGEYSQYTNPITQITMTNSNTYKTSSDTVVNIDLYTSETGAMTLSNFELTINSITFRTDKNNTAGLTTRTLTQKRDGTPMKFTFPNQTSVTFNHGEYYILLFDLAMPLVRFGADYTFGNLYYNETNSSYAFRHHNLDIYGNGVNGRKNEYFNYKSTTTSNNAAIDIKDPCDFVYPNGFYRMPTSAELTQLTNVTSSNFGFPRKQGSYNNTHNSRLINIYKQNLSFLPYSDLEGLQFLQLGYRAEGNDNIFNYSNTSTSEASAQLWSSESVDTNNANYLELKNSTSSDNVIGSILSGNKREGRQIRCVRTTNTSYWVRF